MGIIVGTNIYNNGFCRQEGKKAVHGIVYKTGLHIFINLQRIEEII